MAVDRRGLRGWLVALGICCTASAWAQTVTFTAFPIPTGNPGVTSITAGPDGAMWFVENNTGKVGRITTAGVVTEFSTGVAQGLCGAQIVAGPDGNLWVTFGNASGPGTRGPILRMSTAGSVTGTFETPQPASCAASITQGPDGALWLGQLVLSGDRIGRLTTAGVVSNEYSIPRGGGPEPLAITTGPDGNLWFTEFAAFRIGQLTPAGAFTEFLLPGITFDGTSYHGPTNANLFGITSGPDGALWFTEFHANKIGRITTAGSFTEYPLPTANASPGRIVTGPDGALWFAEIGAKQLGRIATDGTIQEFPVTTDGGIGALALGPDGALWFGQTSNIGRAEVGDGGTPDAGAPDAGAPDAGAPDAGTPDAGAPPDAGGNPTAAGGCHCHQAGGGAGPLGESMLLLGVALAARARRKRRG